MQEKLTQIQFADLKRYVPESDTVKIVFEDTINHKIEDWEAAVEQMVSEALDGDAEALFDLLELTYLNAHNEGMLEIADEPETDRA